MRVVQNSLISEFRATLFFLFNYRKYEERNLVPYFIFLRVSFARDAVDSTRESLRFPQ